ncbi:siderophore ABC transporter substrate-binding protein [Amaricoccus tamworthensis]|uniref:siderophore ABC transporter substrate-binding protein n=1 Tax=Amaricoccus tamworthensis TaxID=57002 RepID=UPI003C7B9B1E
MKIHSTLAGGMLALSAGFWNPAAAEDVAVSTATGEVSVPAAPKTVAVFDVAAIDTLAALDVPIAGVPSPHYVPYLDGAVEDAEVVGTLFEPDFEALVNMNPDLIVIGGRSSEQGEALEKIAPVVDMTVWGDNHIEQSLERLNAYGKLMGREDKAAEITEEFNAKLDLARAAVEGRGNALIVLTNGPKVSAYGAGSRFGWIHSALGLPEAVEAVDVQTHGEAISFEFIAEADPDWLIVVDRGAAIGAEGESARETLDNALVTGTRAWQNDQVIFLTASNLYIAGGGIQSMTITMDEIINAFDKSSS